MATENKSDAPAVPVEPVAWRVRAISWSDTYWHYFTKEPRTREDDEIWEPLYTAPPAPAVADGLTVPACPTCNGSGKEGRHSICRDCDEGASPATDLREENEKADRKYTLGQRVTKKSGSKWTGRIVGFYSTELTPIGYAVESETERGSVQIYPEAALEPA